MIPKIIHYCWLSGDIIPPDYARCMETWKQKLPGYEFVLWDTKRFDIESVFWVKQAFEARLYAFAADYIRLYAVHNYGGIYLDMDMEVVKPFDELLNTDIMLAYENHINKRIEAGCYGAAKGHFLIKKCMEYYENSDFYDPALQPKIMELPSSQRYEFINSIHSLNMPEIMEKIIEREFPDENFNIYPPDYFTVKNIMTGKIKPTKNTFTIHHFTTKYQSEDWQKTRKLEQLIRKIFGENSYLTKKVFQIKGGINRIKQEGLFSALRYYQNKYIK
jgi:mannosyltransferase OCH1-like enzyme